MVYVTGGTSLLHPLKIYKKVGIKQGMVIGDLGCGASGYFALVVARLIGKDGIVYAVDIMKSTLEEVSKRARLEGIDNIKTIWSNLEVYGATKIKSDTLDFGMVINVLFQSKDHYGIVRESARMLKPQGKLLIIDWRQTYVPFGPHLVDRVKPEEVKSIAKKNHLQLVDEFSPGRFHYALIFQK